MNSTVINFESKGARNGRTTMNNWKKIGNDWCVQVGDVTAKSGDVVTVTNREGVSKQVTLGERVGMRNGTMGATFAVARALTEGNS